MGREVWRRAVILLQQIVAVLVGALLEGISVVLLAQTASVLLSGLDLRMKRLHVRRPGEQDQLQMKEHQAIDAILACFYALAGTGLLLTASWGVLLSPVAGFPLVIVGLRRLHEARTPNRLLRLRNVGALVEIITGVGAVLIGVSAL